MYNSLKKKEKGKFLDHFKISFILVFHVACRLPKTIFNSYFFLVCSAFLRIHGTIEHYYSECKLSLLSNIFYYVRFILFCFFFLLMYRIFDFFILFYVFLFCLFVCLFFFVIFFIITSLIS